MKRSLLFVPLLLAACAPAYSGPKPAPNEVVAEVTSPMGGSLPDSLRLSEDREAGISSFARISALILTQSTYNSGLPAGYGSFAFPDGSDSMKILSGKDAPVHVRVLWQATSTQGRNSVNVTWESRPLGGRLVSVTAQATATDASVNTRRIEDNLLRAFTGGSNVRPVAWGR